MRQYSVIIGVPLPLTASMQPTVPPARWVLLKLRTRGVDELGYRGAERLQLGWGRLLPVVTTYSAGTGTASHSQRTPLL